MRARRPPELSRAHLHVQEVLAPVTRVRGIDHRGDSVELNVDMPAADLTELLCEGGWKWALAETDGRPAARVMLDLRTLRRQARAV